MLLLLEGRAWCYVILSCSRSHQRHHHAWMQRKARQEGELVAGAVRKSATGPPLILSLSCSLLLCYAWVLLPCCVCLSVYGLVIGCVCVVALQSSSLFDFLSAIISKFSSTYPHFSFHQTQIKASNKIMPHHTRPWHIFSSIQEHNLKV